MQLKGILSIVVFVILLSVIMNTLVNVLPDVLDLNNYALNNLNDKTTPKTEGTIDNLSGDYNHNYNRLETVLAVCVQDANVPTTNVIRIGSELIKIDNDYVLNRIQNGRTVYEKIKGSPVATNYQFKYNFIKNVNYPNGSFIIDIN